MYNNKKVILNNANRDRKLNNTLAANATDRTDVNLSNRIANLWDQKKKKRFVYRIPLKFLSNICNYNQCNKFNTKFMLMLETEMEILFETNANNVTYLNAKIIFTDVPFIQYE